MSTREKSLIHRAAVDALKLGVFATVGFAVVVADEVFRDGEGMELARDILGGILEESRDLVRGVGDAILSDMDVYQR